MPADLGSGCIALRTPLTRSCDIYHFKYIALPSVHPCSPSCSSRTVARSSSSGTPCAQRPTGAVSPSHGTWSPTGFAVDAAKAAVATGSAVAAGVAADRATGDGQGPAVIGQRHPADAAISGMAALTGPRVRHGRVPPSAPPPPVPPRLPVMSVSVIVACWRAWSTIPPPPPPEPDQPPDTDIVRGWSRPQTQIPAPPPPCPPAPWMKSLPAPYPPVPPSPFRRPRPHRRRRRARTGSPGRFRLRSSGSA